MDGKLIDKCIVACDAATDIFKEIENPTMNLREQYEFAKEKMKPIKAARKALKDARK
jgi:hypothetical protein